MNINLTAEIESALAEAARKQGTTAQDLALECLRARFMPAKEDSESNQARETLADCLAGHLGVLSSSEHVPGGARMSEDCGQKFATGLVQKRQKGRL